MKKIKLKISNETSLLKSVVLGRPSIGNIPLLCETYDATSFESVLNNNYPKESDVRKEMDSFEDVLNKYGVKVYKPSCLRNCNQIFARDIAFVINEFIINPNIISNRLLEKAAYKYIYINKFHLRKYIIFHPMPLLKEETLSCITISYLLGFTIKKILIL